MAGWAAGVFTRARNWVADKGGAINPQAALFDQEDDNFAAGLNNCVTKDGLNKPSAAMDWNSQNLTNVNSLAAAVASLGQLTVTAGLFGPGTMRSVVKAADTSRISTITLTDDPHLSSLTLTAGKDYVFEAFLVFDATTTTGMGLKVGILYGGTIQVANASVVTGNLLPGSLLSPAVTTVSGTSCVSSGSLSTTASAPSVVIITGLLTTIAGGALSVQWAQNSSTANNLNLRRGSYLRATQLT